MRSPEARLSGSTRHTRHRTSPGPRAGGPDRGGPHGGSREAVRRLPAQPLAPARPRRDDRRRRPGARASQRDHPHVRRGRRLRDPRRPRDRSGSSPPPSSARSRETSSPSGSAARRTASCRPRRTPTAAWRHWVRANLFHRPVVALVGARLLPGGRLVSTAAAGRVGLPLRRFLPGSLVSSAVWSVYMLAVGMLLGPMVGGNPFLSLAAGVVMAVLTAGGFAVIQRLRARRRRATPVAASRPPRHLRPPRSSRPDARLRVGGRHRRRRAHRRRVVTCRRRAAIEPGHVDRCRRRLPFHRHRSIAQRSRAPVVVTECRDRPKGDIPSVRDGRRAAGA